MKATTGSTQDVILRMTGISKSFAGVTALDDVSLEIRAGETAALVGENGAGKSTLMKILLGLVPRDSGTIEFKGQIIDFKSPGQALRSGISMIHQEISLVPGMTVSENIWLGREGQFSKASFLGRKSREGATQTLFDDLDFGLDPRRLVATLSIAEMQLVEIARAVSYRSDLIIMDEPTSALTPSEISLLYTTIANLTAAGVSIIFISHKLDEVFEMCQTINVMRDGTFQGSFPTAELTTESLMSMIAGRDLNAANHGRAARTPGEIVLEVKNLSRDGVFENVSFTARQGEVLGFCGLMGSGRTEIMRALYGLDRATGGEVLISGVPSSITSPKAAVRAGFGMVTEDRLRSGSIYTLSVMKNSTLAYLDRFRNRFLMIRSPLERASYDNVSRRLSIKSASRNSLIGQLSGGNQQKVLISRWLHFAPKVLILDEPTRGIDVGAKAEIYELIDGLAADGIAIVVVSSELPELLAICDRIHVVRQGRVVFETEARTTTQEELLSHAFGI